MPSDVATPALDVPHPLVTLGRGSLVVFVGQLVNLGLLLGIKVLVTQSLSTDAYGPLGVGIALFAFLGAVANLGLPTAIARQVAHTSDPDERRSIYRKGVILTLVSAVGLPAVIIPAAVPIAALAHDPLVAPVLEYLSVYLSFSLFVGLLTAFFQGIEDLLPMTAFYLLLSPAVTLVVLVLLLPGGLTLTGALLAYVISSGVTLALLVSYAFGSRARLLAVGGTAVPTPPERRTTYRSLLEFSLPLLVVGIATVTVGSADPVIVGALTPLSVAGAFGNAESLGRLVTLGVSSLAFIMLPVAARMHASGEFREVSRAYATTTKWVLLLAVPFFLIFVFFPTSALMLLYGNRVATPAYAAAPAVLRVIGIGGLVASVLGVSSSVLTGFGALKPLVRATVVAAVIDAAGSFALVPLFGPVGAAVAFSAATIALPAMCLYSLYDGWNVHPFTPTLWKPLIAVTVPLGAVFGYLSFVRGFVPSVVEVIAIFLGVFLAYFLAVPATRSLDWDDGHLLSVVEGLLGRPLLGLRRFGRRFVHVPRDETIPPSPAVGPES